MKWSLGLRDVTKVCDMRECRLIPGFDHSCRQQQYCMMKWIEMNQYARWRGRQDDVNHMYADICDVLDGVKTWYHRPAQPAVWEYAEEVMKDERAMKAFSLGCVMVKLI